MSEVTNQFDMNEADLIVALQADDPASFEQLVRVYGGRMLATAKRFLRNEQDAQDIVQEAFLSAFQAISKFRAQSSLNTWLHRIVVNASLMKLRSKKRKPETSIEELLPKYSEDGHRLDRGLAWKMSVDQVVEQQETREFVLQKIDQLPQTYRSIIMLRDIDQFSTEETATMLELSLSAVKTRLHRARHALKKLLDPQMEGELRS